MYDDELQKVVLWYQWTNDKFSLSQHRRLSAISDRVLYGRHHQILKSIEYLTYFFSSLNIVPVTMPLHTVRKNFSVQLFRLKLFGKIACSQCERGIKAHICCKAFFQRMILIK